MAYCTVLYCTVLCRYWAPTGVRIAPPSKCRLCEWSRTGGLGEGQPDNREERQGGQDEACIAILNNFYNVSLSPVSPHHCLTLVNTTSYRRLTAVRQVAEF